MIRPLFLALLAAFVIIAISQPSGQILNKEARVRLGHYHLNVTSVDDHKKFWVDTLGGTAGRFGNTDTVTFGDVVLFLNVQKPTGGTRGTTFDHIGLAAPDVPALTKQVVAAGYRLTVGRETPGAKPPETGASAVYGRFSYLLGPDDVKVEVVTATGKDAPPIAHHHVHFVNPEYVAMRDWYVKALGATERTGPNTFTDFFAGADLPGIGYMLNFFRWELDEKLTGTAGRVVDHVGFEVRDLQEFARGLAGKGVKIARPYQQSPEMGNVGTVQIVDPWGTVIELTEGLAKAL